MEGLSTMSEVSEFSSVPLSSPDMRVRLWEQLQVSAPEVFADGKLNVEALQNLLGDENLAGGGAEKFGLTWPGKREAQRVAQLPTSAAIHPQFSDSVDWESTRNVFIEGENLETLKALRAAYRGKVKMVYIDPPYNTGHDFVYSDRFAQTVREYEFETGARDAEGALKAGTAFEKNAATSGAFHSNWLSMMYPRLVLARELLAEDGAIFVSIDNGEVAHLRQVIDEIFGEYNFIGDIVWAAGRKNDSKYISQSHEYILCYARNLSYLKSNNIVWRVKKKGLEEIYKKVEILQKMYPEDFETQSKEIRQWYKSLPEGDEVKGHKHYNSLDENGIYFAGDISWPNGGGPKYEVLHPVTGKPVKVPSGGWRFQENEFKRKQEQGGIYFGPDETTVPKVKRYLKDTEFEALYSVMYQDGRAATKRLKDLMGEKVFDYPKDETVLADFIRMVTSGNDLIIDFFAGSGSLAHAAMIVNAQDGENRRTISIQIPERVKSTKGSEGNKFSTISEITRERIRRAGQQVREEYAEQIAQRAEDNPLDTGFRAFTLGESCFKSWKIDSSIGADNLDMLFNDLGDSLKPGAEAYQVLFELLLKAGYRLDETIVPFSFGYKEFFAIAAGVLAFTRPPTEDAATIPNLEDWEKAISKFHEIYGYEPVQLLMIEDALSNENNYANVDSLKLNLVQLAKQHGINREDVLFA